MILRSLLLIGLVTLAACGSQTDPAKSADAEAMAAATRKAVADTDAALHDAAMRPAVGSPAQPTENGEQTAE